jgi:hypothetical protein
MIYCPFNDNGILRTRYSSELCTLYSEPDVVKVAKTGILRWLKTSLECKNWCPCRKLALLHPEGARRVGKPRRTWLGSVEEDLQNMGLRNWRRNSQDGIQWRTILEEAKVHQEL